MRLPHRPIQWGALLAAFALLVSVTMVGCDDLSTGDGDATTSEPPMTTSEPGGPPTTEPEPSSTDTSLAMTTEPPATTPTTVALSSAEEMLPSGNIKAMGYITDVWVDGSGRHLRIDYAEMLTGAEADAAAVAAGAIAPGEHVPNDYWISNVNPKLREFDVSNSVAITTSTRWAPHDGFYAPCTWADFLSFWGPGPLPDGDSHLHDMPWWIERDGDTIVKIDEQYIP